MTSPARRAEKAREYEAEQAAAERTAQERWEEVRWFCEEAFRSEYLSMEDTLGENQAKAVLEFVLAVVAAKGGGK